MLCFSGRNLPKINALWHVTFGPEWRQTKRTISDYQIILIEAGEITFYVEDEPRHAKAGDVLLFTPKCQHWSDHPANGDNIRFSFIHFLPQGKVVKLGADKSTLRRHLTKKYVHKKDSLYRTPNLGELQEIVLDNYMPTLELRGEISRLFSTALQEWTLPWPDSPQRLSLLSLEIMRLLTRLTLRTYLPDTCPKPQDPANLVDEAVRFMQENLNSEVDLNKVAAKLHISSQKMARLFQHTFGVPPHQYLQTLRLEKAKQMLSNTSFTVKETCWNVGIPDPNYFSRLFRLREGVNPVAYRKQTQIK